MPWSQGPKTRLRAPRPRRSRGDGTRFPDCWASPGSPWAPAPALGARGHRRGHEGVGSLTPSARADGRTLSARQARDSRGKRNRKYQTRPSDRPPQPTGDGPHCQLLGHPPAECRSLTRPPRTLSHFWWSGLAWGPPPAHLHLGCTLAPQPSVSPAWGEQAHFHQRGKRILSKTSTHVLGSLPRGRTRQGLAGAAATPAGRDAPWPCTVWARTRGALKERPLHVGPDPRGPCCTAARAVQGPGAVPSHSPACPHETGAGAS